MIPDTDQKIRDEAKENLKNFLAMQEPFVDIHSEAIQLKANIASARRQSPRAEEGLDRPCEHMKFDALDLWLGYVTEMPQFAKVVCALLSIGASEAAVERSFSAQGLIHNELRNRMKHSTIVNEVFININSRPPPTKPDLDGAWIEIDDDADESTLLFLESGVDQVDQVPSQSVNQIPEQVDTEMIDEPSEQEISHPIAENNEEKGEDVAARERWRYEAISQEEIDTQCNTWLRTAAAQTAIMNGRIRFTAVLEGDLESFMQSNGNNDSMRDLKRSIRDCLRKNIDEANSCTEINFHRNDRDSP
jgi:hypothetical protein